MVVLISTVPAARASEQTAADMWHMADCRRACLVSHSTGIGVRRQPPRERAHTLCAMVTACGAPHRQESVSSCSPPCCYNHRRKPPLTATTTTTHIAVAAGMVSALSWTTPAPACELHADPAGRGACLGRLLLLLIPLPLLLSLRLRLRLLCSSSAAVVAAAQRESHILSPRAPRFRRPRLAAAAHARTRQEQNLQARQGSAFSSSLPPPRVPPPVPPKAAAAVCLRVTRRALAEAPWLGLC